MGTDSSKIVSRPSILKIKAAWAEMYKVMVLQAGRKKVEGLLGVLQKRKFVCVILQHSQDEADMRLRSGEARNGPTVPRRGRATKVQLHVVRLKCWLQ